MKRNWIEIILACAAFFVTLAVYIKTLAPTVTFTDAGELAVDCITLGVAHPTGYALFTIVGHLWTLLPLPFTQIYKLNLFAAVCTSLSAVVFFKVALLILARLNAPRPANAETISGGPGKPEASLAPATDKAIPVPVGADAPAGRKSKARPRRPARRRESTQPSAWKAWFAEKGSRKPASEAVVLMIAFASALAYAFARTIWQQATAIEVYSLHLLLVLTVIWLFLRALWSAPNNTRAWLTCAFALGLSLTNHLSTTWLIPGLFYFYFARMGFGKRTWLLLLKMVLPFALGLSLIAYVPLRSGGYFPFHGPPHFDWGGAGRSWAKFVYHVTGRGFSDRMFAGSWPKQLTELKKVYLYQVAVIGVIPMLFGLWRTLRQNWGLLVFLLLLIGTCVGFAVNYDIFDIDSYFALAFTASLLLMAIGFLALAQWRAFFAVTAFLIPVIALGLNYKENDRSRDHLVQDYTRNMVDNLEPNAMVFSGQWDYFVSPFWYYQSVEKLRPDIVMIDPNMVRVTWYLNQLRRWYPEIMKQSEAEAKGYEAVLELFESGKPYDEPLLQARYVAFMNSLIDHNIRSRPIYFTGEPDNIDEGIGDKYKNFPAGLAMRWVPDIKSTRFWNTDFNFKRFLDYTPDPDDHLEHGIYITAAAGVFSSARFQGMAGRDSYAMELQQLSKDLAAKVAQKP